jgi:hypothetical protein
MFAAGLFWLAAGRVQAQPVTLSIALAATYQNANPKTSSNPDITLSSTSSEKFTTATIISAAIASSGTGGSSKGWSLIWDPSGNELGATNRADGGEFDDASTLLDISTDASGNSVTSGSSDPTDPIAQSLTTTSVWNITYDDGNGNTFDVSGLVKMTTSLNSLSTSQQNNGNSQTETISFSGSVSGWGTVLDKQGNTDNAVFTGSISGSGKGAQGS